MRHQKDTRLTEHDLKAKVDGLFKRFVKEGRPFAFKKNWGGKFAGGGEPDYTGCAIGRFFQLEIKSPKLAPEVVASRVTAGQRARINAYHRAGAESLVSNDYDEIVRFTQRLLGLGRMDVLRGASVDE